MTAAERVSLERLEDMLGRRLDRIETKVDAIDTRVRLVEIATAGSEAANEKGQRILGSSVQVGFLFATMIGVLLAIPAAIYAASNVLG